MSRRDRVYQVLGSEFGCGARDEKNLDNRRCQYRSFVLSQA